MSVKWYWPRGAKVAYQEVCETLEIAHAAFVKQKGLAVTAEFEVGRLERDLAIAQNERDEAKEAARLELEEEFEKAREARRLYLDANNRRLLIAEYKAENAVELAVEKLHSYFSWYVAVKGHEKVLGTIPVFSVSTGTDGGRVLVDPDGPLARAILRRTSELMAEMEVDLSNLKKVPDPIEIPSDLVLDSRVGATEED